MNETPRTTEMMQAANDANEDRQTRGLRLLNFARQLERELAEAHHEVFLYSQLRMALTTALLSTGIPPRNDAGDAKFLDAIDALRAKLDEAKVVRNRAERERVKAEEKNRTVEAELAALRAIVPGGGGNAALTGGGLAVPSNGVVGGKVER
jgi:hypothetical protein